MNKISISKSEKQISWPTNKSVSEEKSETTKVINNNSKPKWFIEMVMNAESINDKFNSTKEITSNEIDNLILNSEYSNLSAKRNNHSQIHNKRRNTIDTLQIENQNFLTTLCKSAKSINPKLLKLKNLEEIDQEQKITSNKLKEYKFKTESYEIKTKKITESDMRAGDKKDQFENLNKKIEDFVIPLTPEGITLTIFLKSNWSQENDWIGLNGIEIFDLKTHKSLSSSNIKFINNLETSPQKLFNGNHRTHDEDHIWLCRFDKNIIELKVEFQNKIQVGLIRIWNYNKSRIYSCRGVKDMEIYLDDVKIFDGEIHKASGDLKGNFDKFGDMIVYTLDENDLEKIFENDTSFRELLLINK